MKAASLLTTALVGVLCLLFALGGIGLPKKAGLFPMLVGCLAVFTALICLYLQVAGAKEVEVESEKLDRTTFWTIVMTCACPLLIYLLGYAVGTIVFTVAVLGRYRKSLSVIIGFVVVIVGLWAVFSKVLLLRMPPGIVLQLFS
jgi:hypothetical protein